jgi:cyclophilin family peptidyl-prolyl cis-trans isomerase
MMKKLIPCVLFLLLILPCFSQNVIIRTTQGNITIKLYDDVPLHKENFIDLITAHFYDSLLFHRVIKDFMIQTGDPDSKYAKPGQLLGRGGVNYTIPAEFRKEFIHKKGAVAAARLSDNINPEKASSGSQFYIVQGRTYTDQELDYLENQGIHIKFTEEQRKIYKSIGGTPHLDYSYTVFGEVVDGFPVLENISQAETDKNNRPLSDIRINSISIIE